MIELPREAQFELQEFVIDPKKKEIPLHIADKIYKYHILPMIDIRLILDAPMWASERSGYRSVEWEKKMGRSGNSEHTFKGKGAVDWTTKPYAMDELESLLIESSPYTRIAIYENFIHCDYKATDGFKYIYSSTPSSEWTLLERIKI